MGLLMLPLSSFAASAPTITIIIDDLGYGLSAGKRAIALPGPVSYAMLPGAPRAGELAEFARAHGKEVLLHLPLQPESEVENDPEPGSMRLDMTHRQFRETFRSNLQSVPHAIGVNSHQGSLLTRHPGHMSWLMSEIRNYGLQFFVDSYTTEKSIALEVANEQQLPAVRRNVFLDPDRDPATVAREFARLKKLARIEGSALGIGHPYPATLAYLEEQLPLLEDDGIRLIAISEHVRRQHSGQARMVKARGTGENDQAPASVQLQK